MSKKSKRSNDYRHLIPEVREKSNRKQYNSVTVVIPFYSGRLLLARLLASLSVQTYPKNLFEVIVVSDGPDECEDILEKWLRDVVWNVQKIRRTQFQMCTIRNVGIKAASYPTILFLDSDIITPPHLIESHMKWRVIEEPVATIGLRRFVDPGNMSPHEIVNNFQAVNNLPDIESVSNTRKESVYDRRIGEIEYIYKSPFPGNVLFSCNVAFPRVEALAIDGFDEIFNGNFGYDDIDFGMRLFESGVYIVYEPSATVLHQENVVVKIEERHKYSRNLSLLLDRHPGLKEYRKKLGLRT